MKLDCWYLGRKAPCILKCLKITIKRVPITGSILIGVLVLCSVIDIGSVIRNPDVECKRIRELDCETYRSSKDESRP